MALQTVGNNDFRGYLAYLGQNNNGQPGDAMALNALNFTGNDGGIDDGVLRQYTAGATGNPADDQAGYDRYSNYVRDRYNEWSGDRVLGQNTLDGGSGGSDGGYSQEDIQYLDSQQSLYDRLMESINSTESSGLTRLQDSETSARNKANQGRSRQLEDFGMKRNSMESGKDTALNSVGDNSRMLRDSLMRRLGLGSGGGSAFKVVNNAVARDASKNRQGVLNSYGENNMQLGVSEKRADEDYKSLLDEILADRRAKEETFKAGVYGQRQGIQEAQGQIASDRARLLGGNQLQASAPYRNNYLGLQSQIDQLPNQYRTEVQGRDLNVQTPTLRDYVVDRAQIGGGTQKQQYSPYSQFLNRDKEDEQLQVR